MCTGEIEMTKVLRQKRRQLCLTQQQVAKNSGVSLREYQRFESGETDIRGASFALACRVIDTLDMDISEFYHSGCRT